MAGLPPIISAETGTPSHEWAQKTTTAAFAREDPAPATTLSVPPGVQALSPSTPEGTDTPSRDIPGAYPDQTAPLNTQAITDAAKTAVGAVTATAAHYIPVAKSAAAQAVNTVSSYMPGAHSTVPSTGITGDCTARASDHDKTHVVSLPTTEINGTMPSDKVSGAGALPGSINEEAVSQAPDERNENLGFSPAPYPAAARSDVPLSAPVMSAATGVVGATTAFTPLEPSTASAKDRDPHTATTLGDSMPSTELTGQQPYTHQDGVGSLPGTISEKSVAKLPEEAAVGPAVGMSLPSTELKGQQPFEHQEGVGALPGPKREQGVALLPDEIGGPTGATNSTVNASGTRPRDYAEPAGVPRLGEEQGYDRIGASERKVGRDAVGGVGSPVGPAGGEGGSMLPDERTRETKERMPTAIASGQDTTQGDKLNVMDGAERAERPEPKQKVVEEIHTEKETHTISGGYDTGYHPAAMHPMEAHVIDNAAGSEAKGAATTGDAMAGTETTGDATKDNKTEGGESVGTHGHEGAEHKMKKAGFMDKMKGEAKVLIGKIEGKKGVEKVKEGKMQKAGELPE